MRNLFPAIFLMAAISCPFFAAAEGSDNSPIEVAIFPPVQYPGTNYGIKGLRLSVVGKNREVRGLDFGLLGNITDVTFKGIAISGLFNFNRGISTVTGLQVAGLANINSGNSEVYGLQIAAFNYSGTVHGLQLGLVNIANELHGVQIGLFNVNRKGPFHASPIINASF